MQKDQKTKTRYFYGPYDLREPINFGLMTTIHFTMDWIGKGFSNIFFIRKLVASTQI